MLPRTNTTRALRWVGLVVFCVGWFGAGAFAETRNGSAPLTAATVTVLSSNLANGNTIGEWGFSAFVETPDTCVLFDAGRFEDTVLKNAAALDIDLSCVTDMVLSHFHFDHTAGILPLLEHLRARNPDALARVHVAEGFFLSRRMAARPGEANQMIAVREALEARGVQILEYDVATEILPNIWVTGPVARAFPEKNYPTSIEVQMDGRWMVDHVPESQGLVLVTAKGPIVLLGCGHSGTVNLLTQVRATIQDEPIHALMGGMHLFAATDTTLGWTTDHLRDIGIEHLMAGHCTGIEPLMRLRQGLNLNRRTAVVGAVGSRFVYGEGIHPTAIAR